MIFIVMMAKSQGGNKPPKPRFMNKKKVSIIFFFGLPHQYPLNSLISRSPKITTILDK